MENFCTCIYDARRAENSSIPTRGLLRKAVEPLVGTYSSTSLVAFSLIYNVYTSPPKALLQWRAREVFFIYAWLFAESGTNV